MANDKQVGRLALRREGEFWNAYYAQNDTMEDAVLLGSIRMAVIERDSFIMWDFMEVMRKAMGDLIKEVSGSDVSWGDVKKAPEHEKAGHA